MSAGALELTLATRVARDGIVGAAVGVFAKLGFQATRVEDLLEAAGVARRTFYKYFRSKEEVLSAVYDLATGELVNAMRNVAMGDAAPLDAVRRGLDVYLDYHVENAPLLKVLEEQAIRSDSPLAAARRRFRADLAIVLDGAVRATTGEAHDPMLYNALVSALEGLSLDLLADGARPADVKRAKAVMHLVLARVLTPARPE